MSVAAKLLSGGQDDRWKASTLAFSTSFPAISGSRNEAIFFKPDGLAFYAVEASIRQYSLSSAWDLSSASLDHTISLGGGQQAICMFFSNDGLKFF